MPVALIAGRYWKTLIAAAVTGIALTALSLLVFGWSTWHAWLTTAVLAQSVFETGRVGFYHLVSLFGAVRLVGGGTDIAMIVQALALLGAAVSVAIVWYRRADPGIRAATLIAATLVALPVILFYDLLPATLAMAWLIRDARARGYFPWEKTILCAMYPIALLCRGIGEKTHVPIGWLLTFGLLGLALAHFQRERFAALFPENVARESLAPRRAIVPCPRHAFVGTRGAFEHLRGWIGAEMARDLLHLADPAIGLGIDGRHLALQPGEKLRLRFGELGAQRGRDVAIGGAARRGHADRGEALGQRGVGHFQRRGRADAARDRADIEAEIRERAQLGRALRPRRRSAACTLRAVAARR